MPIDVYVGGMEHAILHLLYSRFIHKFLYKRNLIPKYSEPFKQLITQVALDFQFGHLKNQGLVKGKTHKLKINGKYLKPSELANYSPDEIDITYEKMSKSKGNGISPINIVQEYGSDCLRMTIFFYGPSEKDILWDETMIKNMVFPKITK